ncbi:MULTISPECIES: peroxidase [unclassified Undibacterium]|uniref:Dyp-type peroxidase n=1 Tax=unclassified Undibacterium TaxID=2630295 RepID=UPI002AC9115B|nr:MULTISPECIES: peroxidase [unclassified Undibacterium]MEB0138950.1 peroxidase [Undibacterium sp. CCC2.1]MEB0171719.1 peroxidase [Undibacterium sp. CCC1.1]MEB0175581.1 peroxidase [Undibacterium sp. CCC3.4]MEB0214921.1 peroxidase [Undibacterium sp. 5I2]WPX44905.1 peroxidase [Undibacterium sp. CCC3.4]
MSHTLDLLDIQANVLRAYGRFGYPKARYVFLNIRHAARARSFVAAITARVTTAVAWGTGADEVPAPPWTVNIAFTYQGLKELELPRSSLIGFSAEFVEGMKHRKDMLGDDGVSAPEHWDPIWRENRETRDKDVHIFISLNAQAPQPTSADLAGIQQALAQSESNLQQAYAWLQSIIAASAGGVMVLGGHRGDQGALLDYQDVAVVLENGLPTAKEHFGYTDGIGDPVFEGVPYEAARVRGRGKQMADGSWAALATGEFLLGHIDEAHEYPPAPRPVLLSRNGTYMVYRKLHENVASFDRYLQQEGAKYPGGAELLAAKFVGRWRDNGAPLVSAPDHAKKQEFDAAFAAADPQQRDRMLSDFSYDDDMSGAKCPFSAHMRRINPRASLQMGREAGDLPGSLKTMSGAFDTPGALSNRRRILRRGLPYGKVVDRSRDDGNHGIVIMMLNADIKRQFEFIQQQWINYGNDFKAANDKEILLGNHSSDPHLASKAVLQVDPAGDEAPYLLANIPRFVETRGGEYFFIPSLTALRMIARGIVDPT